MYVCECPAARSMSCMVRQQDEGPIAAYFAALGWTVAVCIVDVFANMGGWADGGAWMVGRDGTSN